MISFFYVWLSCAAYIFGVWCRTFPIVNFFKSQRIVFVMTIDEFAVNIEKKASYYCETSNI
jgi:hypothetical protein